jgi:hypothetical protein
MIQRSIGIGSALVLALTIGSACGSSNDDNGSGGGGNGGAAGAGGSPDNTGSECQTVTDCYPGVDPKTLSGPVQCLAQISGGYCTHGCGVDDDCCKAAGECLTDLKQVCSPFESTGQKMCFLSCEPGDIQAPDGGPAPSSDWEYCQRYAAPSFICRSSGGGAQNRKICVPGTCSVGQTCAKDSDCPSGLTCATGFTGGYCTHADCNTNADCPTGSLCVTSGGKNYCFESCTGSDQCSFCRPWDQRGSCDSNVTFAEAGTSGSVCVPPP